MQGNWQHAPKRDQAAALSACPRRGIGDPKRNNSQGENRRKNAAAFRGRVSIFLRQPVFLKTDSSVA